MPKIVVEGPDGRKFAFPDTMPRSEINTFMKQKYGTKARNETVQDYLARVVREEEATKARAKDIDVKATAAGRAEGERAAERMGVDNPFLMAFAAPAIGLAQQSAARDVYNREGTVLADEAAGLSAINAAGFFVPGMVNKEFGARVEEGRRQQPLAAFAGDLAGGFGPGEIIGAGVSKAVQAIGPGMAALGRMLSRGPGPDTSNAIVGGTLGGIAPAETPEERARNVAVGAGLGYVARPASKLAADLTTPSAPRAMPDAMPAGGYFGRQSLRPPGSGPSAREIETQQQWSTATPIVTQARTTAQTAQQAADAALQSKAPADIARVKDQKKALVGQIQEAQASRAGMDTPEDARLAETLASLTENTSDPVLLSTQISAAKTSLDRLLTDIGSPVEGNLIPVKTQILTRTQAPRSAAEGPQDRASVTRYAEGGDEIKPQGFGASTPKTPQQAAQSDEIKPQGIRPAVRYKGKIETAEEHHTAYLQHNAKQNYNDPIDDSAVENGFLNARGKFVARDDPSAVLDALAAGQLTGDARRLAENAIRNNKPFTLTAQMIEKAPSVGSTGSGASTAKAALPNYGYDEIQIGKASIDVTRVDDGMTIHRLKVPENARGQGEASKALDAVLQQADEQGITTYLKADPVGTKGMTQPQLEAFYKSRGFVSDDVGGMVRPPQSARQQGGLTAERELGSKMKRDKKD